MPAPRALKPGQEVKVARAYSKGTTATDLAQEYGVNASTIRATVVRQGGALRPRGGVPGKSRKQLARV